MDLSTTEGLLLVIACLLFWRVVQSWIAGQDAAGRDGLLELRLRELLAAIDRKKQ